MIAAAAAVLALAAPSRDALIERWLQSNKSHTVARLHAGPQATANGPVPDLKSLAERELATTGRYQLGRRAAPAPHSWWSRVWSWLADRWQALWQKLFARVHVGKETAATIGDVLLAIVALILLITVVRLVRNIQVSRRVSTDARAEPLGGAASAAELYGRACDAANGRDYGAAALLLFAATIALLDGRGEVVASRSATVGDLRRQLRAHNANLLGPFDAVAGAFAERAYAERAIGELQWNRARFAYQELASS